MTTTTHSPRSPGTPLDRAAIPSGSTELRTVATQAQAAPLHTGLTNEKLELMLLFLHAQASKPAAATA